MQKKYMCVDLSVGSGRIMAGLFDGNKMDMREVYLFDNSSVKVLGSEYWDVYYIFNKIKESIIVFKTMFDGITSIGIDTFGTVYGLLSETGELLSNPICYTDPRTKGMLKLCYSIFPQNEFYKISGSELVELTLPSQLLSLKLQNNPVFYSAKTLLMLPDLLNYFLTGIKATEYTIASTSSLLNLVKKDWLHEVIDVFGFNRDMFTNVVMPGNKLGKISSHVRNELLCESIDVINITEHDTASAAIAIPSEKNDYVFISSGTYSVLGVETDKPVIDLRYVDTLSNEGCFGGNNRIIKNLLGTYFLQECRIVWELEGTAVDYDSIDNLIINTKPFISFIDVENTDYFVGEHMPNLISEYCRLSLQPVPYTIGEFIMCITQSMAMAYRKTINQFEEVLDKKIEKIFIVGGGTQNRLLCQMTADCTGKIVYSGYKSSASLGNALVQANASGEISGISQMRQCAMRSFPLTVYEPACTNIWDEKYGEYLIIVDKFNKAQRQYK
ncbi:MAG: FGGY family carbohydrate kinase [Eubacteriales bacterium]|nr:FGGY family carbohydrate kinase [Eubacteriales bacterium]